MCSGRWRIQHTIFNSPFLAASCYQPEFRSVPVVSTRFKKNAELPINQKPQCKMSIAFGLEKVYFSRIYCTIVLNFD
jgi:hypothetical protein